MERGFTNAALSKRHADKAHLANADAAFIDKELYSPIDGLKTVKPNESLIVYPGMDINVPEPVEQPISFWDDPRMALARYEYVWKGNLEPFNNIVSEYNAAERENKLRLEQEEQKRAIEAEEKKEKIAALKDDYKEQLDMVNTDRAKVERFKGIDDEKRFDAEMNLKESFGKLNRIEKKLRQLGEEVEPYSYNVNETVTASTAETNNNNKADIKEDWKEVGEMLGLKSVITPDDLLSAIKNNQLKKSPINMTVKEVKNFNKKIQDKLDQILSNTPHVSTRDTIYLIKEKIGSRFNEYHTIAPKGTTMTSENRPTRKCDGVWMNTYKKKNGKDIWEVK